MRNTESMIGNSAALSNALEQVSHLAQINRPILVLGERGTGKELVAERLHYLSPRWDAPLLKVNCAAMADSLLESELFGHEPGAFTGATRSHQGRFERADGGTLFLDELGTMSLRLQEKLLRLVEYGEFERVGGQQTLRVDVRVIAATNIDLRAMAGRGEFREDLLDRLSFDVVHLPPLRQRQEDIAELAQHFSVQLCAELGWEMFAGFSPNALHQLLQHHWPGNIRELKNAVERSLYRWNDPALPVEEIVIDPFQPPWTEPSAKSRPGEHSVAASDEHPRPSVPLENFSEHMAAVEKDLLLRALLEHGQNQRQTASALGLSYDQLRGLVRKHGLTSRKRRQ